MAHERFEFLETESGAATFTELPHEELARIWTGLQAAAHEDHEARRFVEYFSADAARLFGADRNAKQQARR